MSAKEFRALHRTTHNTKALHNVGLHAWKQYNKENGKAPSTKIIDDAVKADTNYWGLRPTPSKPFGEHFPMKLLVSLRR